MRMTMVMVMVEDDTFSAFLLHQTHRITSFGVSSGFVIDYNIFSYFDHDLFVYYSLYHTL